MILIRMIRFWAVILIFTGFIFYLSRPIYAAGQFIIRMTPGKFEPENLTIKKGDIVEFENLDALDRWPASDIHPTHGIYPEFDSKQPVKAQESWQFKFEKAGIFRFHDHLQPQLSGVIEVLGDKDKETTGLSTGWIKKIKISYKKLYYQVFPAKLQEDLKTFNSIEVAAQPPNLEYWIQMIGGKRFMQKLVDDSEGGSKVDCHQEAHLVGRTAYRLEGNAVFKQSDYNCHSGYLHGAIEAFIAENGGNDLPKSVTRLCKSFTTDFEKFECLHGIGHGFTAYMDYDVPKTLGLCKQLENDYARRSCFGGVFMENILVAEGKGAIKAHQTNWVSEDPHFPCNAVEKNYLVQYECYQMQTSRMLDIFNYDFSPLVEQCLKAPKDMIEVCFKSYGRDAAGQTLRDPIKIAGLCQKVPSNYFQECIRGALNVVIEFWGENMTSQPQQLCSQLDSGNKIFCYNVLISRMKEIFGANLPKIKKVCEYFEKEFTKSCIDVTK